mgnify:CR=1 FL=1
MTTSSSSSSSISLECKEHLRSKLRRKQHKWLILRIWTFMNKSHRRICLKSTQLATQIFKDIASHSSPVTVQSIKGAKVTPYIASVSARMNLKFHPSSPQAPLSMVIKVASLVWPQLKGSHSRIISCTTRMFAHKMATYLLLVSAWPLKRCNYQVVRSC